MKILLIPLLTLFVGSYIVALSQTVDYFGLEKPGAIPKEFNPPVLNLDGAYVFNAIFNKPTCNEFYFTKIEKKENIYHSKKINGKWQAPALAKFSNTTHNDVDPFFTLNGNRVYFVSSRPINDTDTTNDYNIWYADKIDTGWSAPKALPGPINTAYQEYFFSISNHGNAFFSSNRPGGNGSFDIYQVKISADGTMSKPKNIGAPINTSKYEYDPFISPDETFMVFSIKKKGNSDIYISFKNEKEKWSNVINLGDKINISKQDFAPSLTPDNNFLIYTNEGKLKWVSTEILVSLR